MTKNLTNKVNKAVGPYGFNKNGLTWQRNNKIAFDVIGIQLERYSSGISINIGVYFKNLGNETNPIEEMCHLRTSLSDNIGGVDLKRYKEEFDDSDIQVDEIIINLKNNGIPWFDTVKTMKGAMAAISANPQTDSSALLDAFKYKTIELG
jgi:hypothetical protein